MASRKQELERLELQMAKFSTMQARAEKIRKELQVERQGKLYAALKDFVSDAQLDSCSKAEILDIVKAHIAGQDHPLDSITEKEAQRQAQRSEELQKAAGRAAGSRRPQKPQDGISEQDGTVTQAVVEAASAAAQTPQDAFAVRSAPMQVSSVQQ